MKEDDTVKYIYIYMVLKKFVANQQLFCYYIFVCLAGVAQG